MSNRLYVGNLSFKTTAPELGKLFETIGPVVNATIISYQNRSKGYGFVEFKDAEIAAQAVAKLNRIELGGRQISVEVSRSGGERPAGSGRGGFGGGGGRGFGRGGFGGGGGGRFGGGGYGGGGRGFGGGGYGGGYGGGRGFGGGGGGPRRSPPRNPITDSTARSETRCHLGNLPFQLTQEELKKVFEGFAVREALIVANKFSGRSRGYGFVEFENPDEQKRALSTKGSPFKIGDRDVTFSPAVQRENPTAPPSTQ